MESDLTLLDWLSVPDLQSTEWWIVCVPIELEGFGFLITSRLDMEQEDHDGPISLTWPNRVVYLLLKFQPSSLL